MPNNPYIFTSFLSNDKPVGYHSSDLKNIYLSREQLAFIKSEPINF